MMSHQGERWRCPLCDLFAATTLKGVIRHLGAVHSHESITCGLEGCPRSYANFHSYKKHMYKNHRDILEVDDEAASQVMVSKWQFQCVKCGSNIYFGGF